MMNGAHHLAHKVSYVCLYNKKLRVARETQVAPRQLIGPEPRV
jgi:hypothetical protein